MFIFYIHINILSLILVQINQHIYICNIISNDSVCLYIRWIIIHQLLFIYIYNIYTKSKSISFSSSFFIICWLVIVVSYHYYILLGWIAYYAYLVAEFCLYYYCLLLFFNFKQTFHFIFFHLYSHNVLYCLYMICNWLNKINYFIIFSLSLSLIIWFLQNYVVDINKH